MDDKHIPICLFLADRIGLDVGGCKRTHVRVHPPLHREEWKFQSGLPKKTIDDRNVRVKWASLIPGNNSV